MRMSVTKKIINFVVGGAIVVAAGVAGNPAVAAPDDPAAGIKVYLPIVTNRFPATNPFGLESYALTNASFAGRATELKIGWTRLSGVKWSEIQPSQGGAYNWAPLAATFEQNVMAANKLGLNIIVVVTDTPRWASILPTACSAIRADRYGDFANFMAAMVTRYSKAPYNLRYWELGNEIDVDPALVATDSGYGCWGDRTDPLYGGKRYGNMLKVVTPAIHAADSNAKVLAGGLMVANPNTQNSDVGKPEKFLNGVLEAGGAPYIDIVSYHGHGEYYGGPVTDNAGSSNPWVPYGSGLDAKANFVKQIMQGYGVQKPLFFDEASFTCPDYEPFTAACVNPPAAFFDEQANFVIRGYVTALSAGVQALSWYTLEGPGWRNASLLDGAGTPRPVFQAYKALVSEVTGATLPPTGVNYGADVHGWRFDKGGKFVDVVYASFLVPHTITWPAANHITMLNRFGQTITPTLSGANETYVVTNQPVFIERKP